MSNGKTRVLFRIGHLYHRASLDPIYRVMKERGEFDIWQAEMTESRYALWPVSQRRR